MELRDLGKENDLSMSYVLLWILQKNNGITNRYPIWIKGIDGTK